MRQNGPDFSEKTHWIKRKREREKESKQANRRMGETESGRVK